ncbi:hypothetical protein [Streptomyces cadmiisoli]|uniref:hypothetical protein n=1 Tax=Streptomyces cadmiisoli TaxID=2184053 RepID=UPI003648A1A0
MAGDPSLAVDEHLEAGVLRTFRLSGTSAIGAWSSWWRLQAGRGGGPVPGR